MRRPDKITTLALLASLFLLVACDNNVQPVPTPTATITIAATPTEIVPSPTVPRPSATAHSPTATISPTTAPSPTGEVSPTQTVSSGATASPGGRGRLAACTPPEKGTVGLEGLGDPLYPQLGNSGYDAQHYTLDLAVNMETNVISGTATIRALATQDLDAFNLDLEGLEVEGVTVNGQQATFRREKGEMRVAPAAPLKANEEFTVVVAYRGVPEGSRLEGTPVTIGWTRYDKGVYVASEPSGASTWFPVNDHPCDKATYTLRIAVPGPYVVAANGLLKETVEAGDTTTYVWESTQPMASYLVTVNIAEFTRQEQTSKAGVPIRNYFPTRIADDVDDPFARTPEMVDYLGSIFGPYPFDAYGVVVADTNLGFALETQTMSLFGRGVATRNAEAEEVVVHELAHQWFGDSVSLESWRDIWLNEGFATYAQWLWLEQAEGRDAYDARIAEMHQVVKEEAPPPPGNPPADNLFNAGVYLRGGLTLHALRQQVGDEAFFNILKTYAGRYKYGNASTKDFIALSEEVSGQKLEELFDAWLYAADMPDLR